LVDYSTAVDQRRFDDLDSVFTEDAYIDCRAIGGMWATVRLAPASM
jgi:hypothetical protein